MENLVLSSAVSTSMVLILASIGIDSISAHERRLYTIGDKRSLLVCVLIAVLSTLKANPYGLN